MPSSKNKRSKQRRKGKTASSPAASQPSRLTKEQQAFADMLNDPNLAANLPPNLANHPQLEGLMSMRNDPQMIAKLCNLSNRLSTDQVREMVESKLELKEEEKVELDGASLPDDSTCCWVCLDNSPDDDGNPLVRDCACRGTAGFAHLQCIKEYAKSKSGKIDSCMLEFAEHWSECPSCLKPYQGGLAIALSDACLVHYDNMYNLETYEMVDPRPGVKIILNLYRAHIMMFKLEALGPMAVGNTQRLAQAIDTGESILSLFDHMREWKRQDLRTPEIPVTDEIEACQRLCRLYNLMEMVDTPSARKKCIEYSKRAIRLAKRAGEVDFAVQLEMSHEITLARFRRRHKDIREEEEYKQAAKALPTARKVYETSVEKYGEDDLHTISTAKGLSSILSRSGRTIESDRFLTKLLVLVKRILGQEHRDVREMEKMLKEIRERYVAFGDGKGGITRMAVTGYKECGNRYWLVSKSQDFYSVDCDEENVWILTGTPVVCTGLEGAAHLNGRIGDVRGHIETNGRYEVHFSDEGLAPASVRPCNLRILVGLPEGNECEWASYMAAHIKGE